MLWRVYIALQHKDANLTKLIELLKHERAVVRVYAAFFLLAKHEDMALKTLDDVSAGEGDIAGIAKKVAHQWRAGEKEPFKYLRKNSG